MTTIRMGVNTSWRWRATACLALWSIATSLPAQDAVGVAAKVGFVKGSATVTPAAGGPAKPLRKGDGVREGELVQTQASSLVELRLTDDSVIRLAPNSGFKIKQVQAAVGGVKPPPAGHLSAGSVWARITKAVGGETKFNVHTENAVTGVRGTVFSVAYGADGGTMVACFEGAVSVGSSLASPWEKLVGADNGILVAANGAPAEPVPLSSLFSGPQGNPWTALNQEMDAPQPPEPAAKEASAPKEESGEIKVRDEAQKMSPQEMVGNNERAINEMRSALKISLSVLSDARKKKDIVLLNCVNERITQIKGVLKVAEDASTGLQEQAATGDTDNARISYTKVMLARERIVTLRVQAQNCVGAESYYGGETEVVTDIDPALAGGDPFFGDRGISDNPKKDFSEGPKNTTDNANPETPSPPPNSSTFN